MSSHRVLSYSEVSTALDCQARWDFRYGDVLAGSSLKEKTVAPLLSGGRAWGAAVAAWHFHAGHLDAGTLAIAALDESLEADAQRQREHGVFDEEEHLELRTRLLALLHDYVNEVDQYKLIEVEKELVVPIPSRTGIRASTKYRLHCFLDGVQRDEDGRLWGREYKLRKRLTPAALVVNMRQVRWYAWAFWKATGEKLAGFYVNEEWNEVAKQPRLRKDGSPSHDKAQRCKASAYEAVCKEHGVDVVGDTLAALRARPWRQEVPIIFRDSELEEAGLDLVSAAEMIHDLDDGARRPLRNAKTQTCQGCPYRDICPAPDNDLVEALFDRQPPKRDREEQQVA